MTMECAGRNHSKYGVCHYPDTCLVHNCDETSCHCPGRSLAELEIEFIADNMDFPPNFENGPNVMGTDY